MRFLEFVHLQSIKHKVYLRSPIHFIKFLLNKSKKLPATSFHNLRIFESVWNPIQNLPLKMSPSCFRSHFNVSLHSFSLLSVYKSFNHPKTNSAYSIASVASSLNWKTGKDKLRNGLSTYIELIPLRKIYNLLSSSIPRYQVALTFDFE